MNIQQGTLNKEGRTREKLIIFVKNEEAGKTKTRLAATIGDEQSLEVYQKLLGWTFEQTRNLEVAKEVWYSRFIAENDIWEGGDFKKQLQSGENLGKRMSNAFQESFMEESFQKVVIIGSDCAELSSGIIQQAFQELEEHEFVIGPAEDGGYYLLGMRNFYPEVFEDIEWSTGSVFQETIEKIQELGCSFTTLKELNDVDTIEDWNRVKSGL
ncbi:MAG: TIGR04282 family arsenosugar biosynthesis glycosyltransferase [Gracilimonas sp.]|uniref:TIGR04282 family arsenosugar biosynthesis glycosyltransferase n=1 Tax=Gracilimonas sp. TaxID=1974203 RepID=UPI0032ED1229